MAEEKKEEIYRGPSIRVSTSGIATKLQEFKVEMDNMNRIIEEVKTSTNNAKNYWKGEESESTFGEIDIFQQRFEEINNDNKKREEFLKNIIGAYTTLNKNEINAIDEHLGAYSINDSAN